MTESEHPRHLSARTPEGLARRLCRYAAPIILFLILSTENSYADAGTPLMWVITGHLIFGNAIIGLVEGIILALIFRARVIRCILIMVPANYVSMIAGLLGEAAAERLLSDSISINNLLFSILALGAVSFAVTIIIEWPFCYWALKRIAPKRYRALGASALINAVSYAVLIPIYLSVSTTSLISNAKADDVANFAKSNKTWVYYLSENGDTLFRVRPDGTDRQKIKPLDYKTNYPKLTICTENGVPCLAVAGGTLEWRGKSLSQVWKPVIDSIPGLTFPCQPCDSSTHPNWNWKAADLRPLNERDWEVTTVGGLVAKNNKTRQELVLTLYTPLLDWDFRIATVLPGDQVICQLGKQIVLVDLNSRRIGLISHGVSPVVILDK